MSFHWVSWSTASGEVPSTAVLGGIDKDKNKMYVARAYHEGDWIPGKVIPKRKRGYVSHDGREHEKHDFELLCEQRFEWTPNSGGKVPAEAVEGGTTSSGETLYIGRVWHDGTHTSGKVHSSFGGLFIPYNGKELRFTNYEILVLREY